MEFIIENGTLIKVKNLINETKVIIPEEVISIGDEVFKDCTWLTNIIIPNSVKSIGNGVFNNCQSLDFTTEDGLKYLGNESNPYLILVKSKSSIKTCTINKNTKIICNNIFGNREQLDTVVLPKEIIRIPNGAFKNCVKLTSISIPKGVTKIGNEAFKGCANLTKMILPDGVISIGSEILNGCNSLTEVKIPFIGDAINNKNKYSFGYLFGSNDNSLVPKSLKTITITGNVSLNSNAFKDCKYLENLKFHCEHISVEYGTFENCYHIKDVILPNTIDEINFRVFNDCKLLGFNEYDNCFYLGNRENPYFVLIKANLDSKSIKINKTTKVIADSAFADCKNLTNISIHDGVEQIRDFAFTRCSRLTDISIPSSVKVIGYGVFAGCSSLTNITTPLVNNKPKRSYTSSYLDNLFKTDYLYKSNNLKTVTIINSDKIRDNEFELCKNLTNVIIPDTVTYIGENAFAYCENLQNLIIPETVKNIGKGAFEKCESLTHIDIPSTCTSIENKTFKDCKNLKEIIIPNKVTRIGESAFRNCTNIRILVISNGVKTIGDYAFAGCVNLKHIVLPDSLNEIGFRSFENCKNLMSIIIPNNITKVGWRAFEGCESLIYNKFDNGYYLGNYENPYFLFVKAISKNVISYEINENTKIISSNAFENCNELNEIKIPMGVKQIGEYAFSGCSKLKNIEIPKSVINIGCKALDSPFENITIYSKIGIDDALYYPYETLKHIWYINENNEKNDCVKQIVDRLKERAKRFNSYNYRSVERQHKRRIGFADSEDYETYNGDPWEYYNINGEMPSGYDRSNDTWNSPYNDDDEDY